MPEYIIHNIAEFHVNKKWETATMSSYFDIITIYPYIRSSIPIHVIR